MHLCPKHIEDSVVNAQEKFSGKADEFHQYFQVVCCKCASRIFHLFVSNKDSVKALCAKCRRTVLIYDLDVYPAATKLSGEEIFEELDVTTRGPLPIYVGYEYGEFDDDQVFDQNDITWCQVFVEKGDKLLKVFDDETA